MQGSRPGPEPNLISATCVPSVERRDWAIGCNTALVVARNFRESCFRTNSAIPVVTSFQHRYPTRVNNADMPFNASQSNLEFDSKEIPSGQSPVTQHRLIAALTLHWPEYLMEAVFWLGSSPASVTASFQRAQYFPFQSDSLMPVSRKNRSLPNGFPPLASAVRLISCRMCCLFIQLRRLYA
jgi:hypothetical protein